MALQNIGAGNRDDAFYRYKMPKLITKIEGRGNGIKTNVVNMVDVAKALARNPAYTTKYFGCELGAQSKYDEKTGTSIVNGAHDTSKLASLLENFIKKYVQCYGCGNPETEVVITKTQLITLKCAACGYVSDVDMRDKLTTFILKNPPEQKKGGKKDRALRRAEKERLKEGEAADELMKKNKRETLKKSKSGSDAKVVKKKTGSDDEEHSPSASQADEDEAFLDEVDGVQWQTDTSAEAAKKRIIEQLTAATSEMVMVGNGDDLKESSPKAKTPAKPKTLKKSSSKKSETDNEANETTEVESPKEEEISPRDKFLTDFKECLMKSMTPAQMAAILNKAEPQSEAMDAFFVALFEGCGKGLHKEISKQKSYLDAAVQDETSQKHLLAAIETFCAALPPNASKEIALLLKVLYDAEILEEEQILLWYDAVPSENSSANGSGAGWKAAFVRKSALPFVDWLRSAEAESEEEDEE